MCLACDLAAEAASKPGMLTQILGYVSAAFLLGYSWICIIFPKKAKKILTSFLNILRKIDKRL